MPTLPETACAVWPTAVLTYQVACLRKPWVSQQLQQGVVAVSPGRPIASPCPQGLDLCHEGQEVHASCQELDHYSSALADLSLSLPIPLKITCVTHGLMLCRSKTMYLVMSVMNTVT